MQKLSLSEIQQVSGGVTIHTEGKTVEVSGEGISDACAQALPSIMNGTLSFSGLSGQSPCSQAELSLFKKRYEEAVLNSFNIGRTFQHKQRISFPMRRG